MTLLHDGPADAPVHLVLAHGAGAPMDTPFMDAIATGLAARGGRVTRFEFPYMARRRTTGKRGGPGSANTNLGAWRDMVDELGPAERLVIGGKSMGGRLASMLADELEVRALVCLGYPFHPPGRPEKLRTAHLEGLRTPALIVQGERDPFGVPADVAGYRLSDRIEVHWLADGDHSFKPRKKSGTTLEANLVDAVEAIDRFLAGLGAA